MEISPPPPLTPPACKDGKLTQKIPLRLDETTAAQRILSHPRVLVNLDVYKPGPSSLSGELEGEVPPMEPRKPCYDGCVGIAHHEIKSPLLPLLRNGDGSIDEENRPKSKTMISKRKVIKAGLKVLYRKGMGKVRKFFVALRKLTKKYKKIAKKVKNYFLLFVVISVLTFAAIKFIVSPLTAVPVLVFAGIIIAACKFFYDWSCKT